MTINDLKPTEFTGATILLPIVDEVQAVKKTVGIILDTCDNNDIEEILLVVSKKANEKCMENLAEIKKNTKDVNIKVVVQTHPYIGGAARDAFEIAKGSHFISMPSDLELDPCCAAEMIKESKKHPDKIITTSRWLIKNNFIDYNQTKKIINCCAQKFLAVLFNVKLTDITSPTQLCPTKIYQSINWERYDFPFLLEISLKPIRLGVEFVEIPVRFLSARNEGKSSNSFFNTAMYLPVAFHNRFMKKSKILKQITI